MKQPWVRAGEAAVLQVTDTSRIGAFVDIGLPKDLLVPHREQIGKMERGRWYLVYVYCDNVSDRLVGSMRIHKYLNREELPYVPGDEVSLWIGQSSDLGYVALIGDKHYGMLYHNEIFRKIEAGERCTGYIKELRPDGKIDLTLQSRSSDTHQDLPNVILQRLSQNNGFLMMNDATPPIIIYNEWGVSKKVFKRAIGNLYKAKKITIESAGIRLVETETPSKST
ncbi:MAG: GntR family transcriptional regulator [Verrucomicrobia bacterium]|nr:GntR family transcriptional regulator [Verrucomicrobiota bacterium]